MPRLCSFPYQGGKARLRKWLVSHFPREGNDYIEIFSGLGNVYYYARGVLKFNNWHLNDTNRFLKILSKSKLEFPESVNKEEFQYWKNINNETSILLEPVISFCGKNYGAGFRHQHPSHPPFNGKRYYANCLEAQNLLSGAKITNVSWEYYDYSGLTTEDFVYFDPPYYGTKVFYNQIDHFKLIGLLNSLPCKWALSSYKHEIFDKLNYRRMINIQRNSEIKSQNEGKKTPVVETLYTNYV